MEQSPFHSLQVLLNFIAISQKYWGGLHPSVVHFPIALLFTAPLFILIGIFFQKSSRTFHYSSLILMGLGTAGVFLATSTGNSAADQLEVAGAVLTTLETHIRLAEQTKLDFFILSSAFFLYAIRISLPAKTLSPKLNTAILCLFLIVYCSNLIILFNAAHYGGKLVHQYGIKSTIYSE